MALAVSSPLADVSKALQMKQKMKQKDAKGVLLKDPEDELEPIEMYSHSYSPSIYVRTLVQSLESSAILCLEPPQFDREGTEL